jgi:hypothetical protein
MFPLSEGSSQYPDKINEENFDTIALELFNWQYQHNLLYQAFVNAIGVPLSSVSRLTDIPFLPISFFKTHQVSTGFTNENVLTFRSSATTGTTPSQHFVPDPALYEASLLRGFREVYGDPSRYAILGLLPSYLERQDASLVYMARVLMRESAHPDCGFHLHDYQRLHNTLTRLEATGQPVLLLGVTFALLDFAAAFPMQLKSTLIMETGGMKGRGEEWTREQVHNYLKENLGLSSVSSEYGMTELLSQAYAPVDGLFYPAPTMRVLVREATDPLTTHLHGSGQLQVIDLVNVYSCAFIATEDVGTVYPDGSFGVLGRADHTALRGCSLMAV